MQAHIPATHGSPVLAAITAMIASSTGAQGVSINGAETAFGELVSQLAGPATATDPVCTLKSKTKKDVKAADDAEQGHSKSDDATHTAAAATPTAVVIEPAAIGAEQSVSASHVGESDKEVATVDGDCDSNVAMAKSADSEDQKLEGAEQEVKPEQQVPVFSDAIPLPPVATEHARETASRNVADDETALPVSAIDQDKTSSTAKSPAPSKEQRPSRLPESKAVAQKTRASDVQGAPDESAHKVKIDDRRQHPEELPKQDVRSIDASASTPAQIKSSATAELSLEATRSQERVPSLQPHVELFPTQASTETSKNTVVSDVSAAPVPEKIPNAPIPQIQAAELLRHGDKAELKVDLKTPELGHVQVSAALRDETVHATVKVENSEVRDFITSEIGRSDAPLGSHNLKVQAFDASCSTNTGGAPSQQERAYQVPQRTAPIRSEWKESARTAASGPVANLRDDRAVDLLA